MAKEGVFQDKVLIQERVINARRFFVYPACPIIAQQHFLVKSAGLFGVLIRNFNQSTVFLNSAFYLFTPLNPA
ncbi:hypothetical protein A3E04_03935 [Candidatus Kuenenbacteria bacterium RIFCSPHIGHO2_12_FULL_42_14]|uniref:Uncharacterized protein n=1 Tax=Candidatus Kuenenbacteria bacterium RIFCSPHIGHO2_12_FULL_42_14 TaxID=1798563 RepID=A0A1F6GKB4_9BACT|nr:MAG: hypothetical protein A3C68_01125 [Candidatus Kuenenbacteria bacterium RIFCSPHIGHO2_02_FULL_42_29]OGG98555.1 MAG: hypothetical protein A3E04_03935 [Candidatus Kuenenbacteria bacterium RIFCSPHIGHO2_12_FULL_42_14]